MRMKVAVAVVVAIVAPTGQTAYAAYPEGGAGASGRTIDVSAGAQQFVSGGRPSNWSSPCDETEWTYDGWEHPPFDPEANAGTSESQTRRFASGQSFATWKHQSFEGEKIPAGLSWSLCRWKGEGEPPEDGPGNGADEYVGAHWYPTPPTDGILVEAMYQRVQKEIGDPSLSWINQNAATGQVYVRIPNAFVLDPIGFVRATASVSNELGSASAWIMATPTRIDVTSSQDSTSCLVAVAMTDPGADNESPPCSLVFDRTSPGETITVTLTWTITASVSSGELPATLQTSSTQTLPITEVQSLVTGGGGLIIGHSE